MDSREMNMTEKKKDYITLQQFMKVKGVADTGGQAKFLVKELDITVNGEKENRRGRKLYAGDIVVIEGRKYRVEG